MEIQNIDTLHSEIGRLLHHHRLVEALDLMGQLVAQAGNFELDQQFQQLRQSYDFMLQYAAQGVTDPKRDEIHQNLLEQAYRLADQCLITLMHSQSSQLYFARKRSLCGVTLQSAAAQFRNCLNKYKLLTSVPAQDLNHAAISKVRLDGEKAEITLFNTLWVTFPIAESDLQLLRELMADAQVHVTTKALLVSALLLGLTKFYDERKLLFLLELYASAYDPEVQLRALTAAFIVTDKYASRVKHSLKVRDLVGLCSEKKRFKTDLTSIYLRLIRARNTDNITRKVRDEFLPGLQNLSPDLLNQLKQKGSIAIDPANFDDNPEWQQWLEQSGITKKMEELNDLQMQGDDVFVSTFSHLKSFPFFNTMANWFMPYQPEHSSIMTMLSEADMKIARVLKDAPFLCDSDKFSLIFSLSAVPQSQRDMMQQQIGEQANGLREETAGLASDTLKARDLLVNSYVQDLYRFNHLFQRRAEFYSVFDTEMRFLRMPFLSDYLSDNVTLTLAAEFYLKNKFYTDAADVYRFQLKHVEGADPHVLQKIGLAYQAIGDHDRAITYYKRFELSQENDLWNTRHLAACYRATKQFQKALECYERVSAMDPDNALAVLFSGHCLLELGKVDEALKRYYQADFMMPGSAKVLRSLAWCTFVSDEYEQSARNYAKLMQSRGVSAKDHLNYGHLLIVQGQFQQAVEQYGLALKGMKADVAEFERNVKADRKLLLSKNVDPLQLTLMAELVVKKVKQ